MTSWQTPQAAREIVEFWSEAGPDRWWKVDPAFDATIRERFGGLLERAKAGELEGWAETPEGALALVILLDQFSRNLFRGTPGAFASDLKALAIAEIAVERGFDRSIDDEVRMFLYMPFMHCETLAAQRRCVELFEPFGGDNLRAAREHRHIIKRFGRFPHRNAILGRISTEDELRFLADGGFSG